MKNDDMKNDAVKIAAGEIAERIRREDTWNAEACGELCRLAGLEDEWEAADGDTFEAVVFKAAERLGVEIA